MEEQEMEEAEGRSLSLSWTEPSSSQPSSLTSVFESDESIIPKDRKAIHSKFKLLDSHSSSHTDIPDNMSVKELCPPVSDLYPRSYHERNLKERILIEYFCREFTSQCKQKYPRRKPPVLILPNELGIPKMVCTSLNLSKIPFHGFNTWQNIVQFLSQHMILVPLEPLNKPPTVLRSPNTVLASQRANCLEMSNLLVSLLNGINIDAYVVLGYATHQVCNYDQPTKPCPVTINIPDEDAEVTPTKVHLENHTTSSKYLIDLQDSKYKYDPDKNRDYESKTDKKNKLNRPNGQKEKEDFERKRRKRGEESKKRLSDPPDSPPGCRYHSWVLVYEDCSMNLRKSSSVKPLLSSTRTKSLKKSTTYSRNRKDEVSVCFPYFLEPSTGMRHEVKYENYIGIEAVWNHSNYWWNRQSHFSGCSNDRPNRQYCADLTFNLNDRKVWKCLLKVKWPHTTVDGYTNKRLDVLKKEKSRTKIKNLPQMTPRPCVRFKMPHTWTETITLQVCKYLGEIYGKQKERRVKYHKTILEQFKEFRHSEGLVTRLSHFLDVQYLFIYKILEEYRFRKDKMRYRRVNYTEQRLEEYFLKGRRDSLKVYNFKQNDKEFAIKVEFFDNDRTDRMKSLHVMGNYDIIHMKFENRKDFLKEIYSETFSAQGKGKFDGHTNGNTTKNLSDSIKKVDPFVSSAEMKCSLSNQSSMNMENSIAFAWVIYNRNPAIPLDKDVERVTFFQTLDQIEVEYHSDEMDIIPVRNVITKTQFVDQCEASGYLKIYPKNSYELNSQHSGQCFKIIKRFKDLQNNVLQKLYESKSLMEEIINDRSERRKQNELLTETMLMEPKPVHKVEEHIKNIKGEFRKRLSSWLESEANNGHDFSSGE